MASFTTNVKNLRKSYKLSQRQIAESIGIKQTTYSDYERGRSEPTIEVLKKLATFFHVYIDDLIGFTLPLVANKEERELLHDLSDRTGRGIATTTGEAIIDGYKMGIGDKIILKQEPAPITKTGKELMKDHKNKP